MTITRNDLLNDIAAKMASIGCKSPSQVEVYAEIGEISHAVQQLAELMIDPFRSMRGADARYMSADDDAGFREKVAAATGVDADDVYEFTGPVHAFGGQVRDVPSDSVLHEVFERFEKRRATWSDYPKLMAEKSAVETAIRAAIDHGVVSDLRGLKMRNGDTVTFRPPVIGDHDPESLSELSSQAAIGRRALAALTAADKKLAEWDGDASWGSTVNRAFLENNARVIREIVEGI